MKRKTIFLRLLSLVLLPALFIFISCNKSTVQHSEDTPTTGSIKIAADANIKPLVSAWIEAFQGLYPEAHINVSYYDESELFSRLVKDSVFFIISSREANKEEKDFFIKKLHPPYTNHLATEGVALIVNPANKDTLLAIENIFDLLSYKSTKWNELSPKSKNDAKVNLVFDGNKSGIVRYFFDTLPNKKITNPNLTIGGSCKGVIEKVASDKNALGFINLQWISDGDDSTGTAFLSSIRVVEVSPADTSEHGGYFYKPYLANIALKKYSFPLGVYAINTEGRVGLATGFASFLAGERGQRIALKMGVLPAAMPVRLVKFTK